MKRPCPHLTAITVPRGGKLAQVCARCGQVVGR
ncbi:hypothetical protein FDI63_gp077 [Mycobacterium phage ChrisnMich]|uniref:Uncharacterized protein n=2 Tax=Coopervirus TaxID=1982898 RepID=A0A5Q2WLR7_9CAUD|nr:hypothetical protein FDI63_gp077 [Mycobacterium phage ChrisnMich]AEJ94668.1 hypothetical protein CHRISNMICH_77 [Mycobacterium phage ChrisnMich]QGH80170.1 hypothetical protein SEA_MITHRIL_77 [Mycobacterium phage Mithril]